MSAGLLSIYAKPSRTSALLLSWALFATGIGAYLYASHARHLDNPEDRVMPTPKSGEHAVNPGVGSKAGVGEGQVTKSN